jgi:hypothetical protein
VLTSLDLKSRTSRWPNISWRCRESAVHDGVTAGGLPLAPAVQRQYRWADEMVSQSLE